MMVYDNQPGYPMVIRVRVTLMGTVDLDKLAMAFDAIVQRHPLLSARIRPTALGLRWVRSQPPALRLVEKPGATLAYESLDAPVIDLTQGAGLIGEAASSGEITTINLWVHHACSDGLGLSRFFRELMIGYENCLGGCQPGAGLGPAGIKPLMERNRFPLLPGTARERWQRLVLGLKEALDFGALRPCALGEPPAPGDIAAGSRHHLTLQLRGRDLVALRQQAARLGCQSNDIFIAAVLRAIANWRGRHQAVAARETYSLLVPCNLRRSRQGDTPVANLVGYGFLARSAGEIEAKQSLIKGIGRDMAFIRDNDASLIFMRGLAVASWVPGLVPALLRSQACFATAVASNLGGLGRGMPARLRRPDGKLVFGGAVVDDITGFTPVRPGTALGILASQYAGTLTLGINVDALRLTEPDARALATLVVDEMTSDEGLIAGGDPFKSLTASPCGIGMPRDSSMPIPALLETGPRRMSGN